MAEHLAGAETVALNLVNAAGLCRALVLDLDGAAHGHAARDWRLVRAVAGRVARGLGLPAPVASASGRVLLEMRRCEAAELLEILGGAS